TQCPRASGGKLLDDPHFAMRRREVIDKVRLERRLDHGPEEIAGLVLVHGLDRFPQAHGIPRIGIIHVADQPPTFEAIDGRLLSQKDLLVRCLITLPLAGAYSSPNDAHIHLNLPLVRTTRSATELG